MSIYELNVKTIHAIEMIGRLAQTSFLVTADSIHILHLVLPLIKHRFRQQKMPSFE
ncbi:hypothetical protein BC940DRAFT_336289 [Gongronella butleri]|nr:hypothetical protein BC940DRAFT_336289 [Gongronella butleri]